MKESELIMIRNKVETLGGVANQLIKEINNVKQLAIGTLETIKQMPDYEEAIEQLKKKVVEEPSKAKKIKPDRKDSK